jgi:hypothetical protein
MLFPDFGLDLVQEPHAQQDFFVFKLNILKGQGISYLNQFKYFSQESICPGKTLETLGSPIH